MRMQRTGGLEKSSFLWDLAGQAEDSCYDVLLLGSLIHINQDVGNHIQGDYKQSATQESE
jgi:hypothetical protein